MKLKVGYFYKDLLNLYGDNGNIEVLQYRAERRSINFELINIGLKDNVSNIKDINLIFMGGGPDSSQKALYRDLLTNKAPFLKDYIGNSGVGLFICGAYQLLGKYYKAANGEVLKGLGIFDLYTEHPGGQKNRCIGNTVAKLSHQILNDNCFINVKGRYKDLITGFENHGGRTYLGDTATPLGFMKRGNGNNSEDGTEGVVYKNAIGTYFHGPFLARNPHFADYLIAKSLKLDNIKPLDNDVFFTAYTASLKLK